MKFNRFSCLTQAVTISSHTFLPHLLGEKPAVLDLGANRGNFRDGFFARFTPGRYVAVEANPALAAKLQSDGRIEVVPCAIAGEDKPLFFSVAENIEASAISREPGAGSVRVEGMTFATLLATTKLSRIDLLKMDIEGAELPVILRSPESVFAGIGQMTIEFHDFCAESAPEGMAVSATDVKEMVRRLESLGFLGIRFSRDNTNWCFARRGLGGWWRVKAARFITAPARRLKHLLQS